jgi:hypothetical protein
MMAEGKAPESSSTAAVPDGHGLAWRRGRPWLAEQVVAVRIGDLESRDAGEGTDPRAGAERRESEGAEAASGSLSFSWSWVGQ